MCMHPYIRVAVLAQGVSAGASTLTILTWQLIVTPSTYYDILPQVPWHTSMLSLPGYDLLLKSV